MSQPNPVIFREYDIRGRDDDDLSPEVAFLIGRGFGTYLRARGGKSAVVGRDNRTSSRAYGEAARAGLRSAGVDVVDIGLVVTPAFYYARLLYGADGGIMVTGSHNPPGENGFKLAHGDGTLYGPQIQEVREIIQRGRFAGGYATVDYRDPARAYLDMIRAKVSPGQGQAPAGQTRASSEAGASAGAGVFTEASGGDRRLKVAVDAGNGTASLFAPDLLSGLGHDVVPIHCVSDPTFPNHFPDPVVPANLTDLIRTVREQDCDLGVAFDGDGDRLGVVDDLGSVVWGDTLMILFWREILPRHPGTVALVEVKCSQALPEEIRRLGGNPLFCRTGHSLIKAKMKETGAPFAGEMSGHLFFADEYYGYDDALYATARLLRLLSRAGRRLSELLSDVPRYYATPEVRVACPDSEKFRVVQALKEDFAAGLPVIDVDGVRAVHPDGWSLVRASNTQPVLVLRCESRTPHGLARIKADLESRLERFPELGPVSWQ